MLAPSLQVALTKARTGEEQRSLERLVALATQLDRVEADFEHKINASKALRGEAPTKLTKAQRERLAELAADERELEAEQLVDLEVLSSAREIVEALHLGMEDDIRFWGQTKKHAHAADWPVIEELVSAKNALFQAMAEYLLRPETGDA